MSSAQEPEEPIKYLEISSKYIKHYPDENLIDKDIIARGGFGVVYKATDKLSGITVAMKSLLPGNNKESGKVYAAFVQELKYHKEVNNHPNIIRFLGLSKSEKVTYSMIFEFAEGGTLHDYLMDHKDLPWSSITRLGLEVTNALKYLHSENIIHKDLCSGNILVHMGTAKLADFGCSSELTAMMPTSNHVGKTAYMDPKITDRAYKRGKKSDIYSLGILLWEIASGERPYKDVEQEMIMFYVMQGNRPESALERPKEYVSLYSQCWDGDPDKRPDCEEVYERLESINKQAQEQAQLHQEPSNETSIKQTDQTVKKIELRGHELAIQIMKLHDDESTKGVNADKVIEKIRDWLIQNKYEKEDIFNQLKSHKDCGVCMFLVGQFYWFGVGTDVNRNEPFNWYLRAHEKGNAQATFFLGSCFALGKGVSKDKAKAAKFFEQSADRGYAPAECAIARWYQVGHLGYKDIKKAVEFYQKAASQGHMIAQYRLGDCYDVGSGVDMNKWEASQLYQKAADQGYVDAQYALGFCYFNGYGVLQDKQKAIELYQLAVDQNHTKAQYALGQCYAGGNGIGKNMAKAIELYQKAADKNDSDAQWRLGRCYELGDGIEKDLKKAISYYQLAAKENFNASRDLERFKSMS